ncbi:hypothetical protein [Bradyrhizobium sp. HKCCYLR1023]|uniref:hypothetical protein n=1 Tax=Bradyrhizobium TaxID=374 RepID=UPI003EBB28A8
MSYATIGILLVWTIAGLPLWALWLNDLRVIHNHIAPSASDMRYMRPGYYTSWLFCGFRFSAMDPAKLTEPGREHLKIAIRHERILWGWLAGGFLIILALGTLR